jgi:IS30 family transposase
MFFFRALILSSIPWHHLWSYILQSCTYLAPPCDQYVSAHLYTLTADNGKESAEHKKITRELKAEFFFTYPYGARERGSTENLSGLICQYIPQKCEFKSIRETDVELGIY